MLVDVWGLIKSYVPSKDKTVVAERFIDIALDHGIEDHELRELMGNDEELDEVISELERISNRVFELTDALM